LSKEVVAISFACGYIDHNRQYSFFYALVNFPALLTNTFCCTDLSCLLEGVASYIAEAREICTNCTAIQLNWHYDNINNCKSNISSGERCGLGVSSGRGRGGSARNCCNRLLWRLALAIGYAIEKGGI
jgi:hypothetical protein